ncbi:MAG: putative metalloprotease CJM1_0395 family protein [Alphaproteobacteria bacterium]|nr:putative metalloprotease CJM1_0395 family protein [Alphaproteobacteria bacterium]
MISGVSSSVAVVQSVAGAHNRSSSAQEAPGRADPTHLSEEQQQQVARLKERDREVRAHEQAHSRAGGPYAGAPSYEFERGPDGHMYAVSGEVQIDSAPIDGDPEATIAKLETVIRAALSPQDPSAQDSRVAAQARAAKAEAQAELQKQNREEASDTAGDGKFAGEIAHGRAAEAYESTESLISLVTESALSVAA